jgi:hypothetical protein
MPFKMKSLLKSLKESNTLDEVFTNKLKLFSFNFIKEFKQDSIRIKSEEINNKYENILYSNEINENNVLNTYLYCPYLFLNCTNLQLFLKIKNKSKYPKELLRKHSRRGKKNESREFDDQCNYS